MTERVNLWRNAAQAWSKDYGWNPYVSSDDAESSITFDIVDQKTLAEELYANHPVAKAMVNNATSHTTLSGIAVSVDTKDSKLNDALELHIRRWSESRVCDASKRLDLSGIFRTSIKNLYLYGESFGLIVNTSQKYPVSFRGLDWHQLADPNDSDRIVRHGVEVDSYNRALRLWLNSNGKVISKPYFDSEGNPIVLQAYNQEFFGTSHGVVPFTSVYKMLLDLSVFIKSEVSAAANSSQINIIQKRSNPTPMMNQLGSVSVSNGVDDKGIKTQVLPVRPNMHLMMGPNDSIEQFKLERPSAMFQPFTEYINKICCAAFGLSYEYLFSSWSDSNFSSARINALQNQAIIRANQKLVIDTTIKPLVFALVKSLVETDVVSSTMDLEEILDGIKIIPPQMPLLDPQREIAAATARIDANLSNLQIEAEKMGLGDYMTILTQLARESEEKKALNLEGTVVQPPEVPGAKPGEASTKG